MKKTFRLIFILFLSMISCSEKQQNLHGLDKNKLETETKEFILSDKQARNYVKKEVAKINEFEVNLLGCFATKSMPEYLENEIKTSEDLAKKYKEDWMETKIGVYLEMMDENNKRADSLYKVLANTKSIDSIFDCHYYLKNDFTDKTDDEQIPSQWNNLVDKNSKIYEHMLLLGFDD